MFRVLFLLFFVGYISCKSNNKPDLSEETIPADFLAFYDRFSSDSTFQLESIVFPLEGRPALLDSMDSIPNNFKWQKDEWLLHKQFNDGNGTFSRSFTVFNEIVSEDISEASGQFTMIRRFAKTSDGWKLIYYKEMGK
jgi:hypothetical protein